MTILSFKSKRDKEALYEKAKKMEKYASMIVECLEDAGYNEEYEEDYRRMYRGQEDSMRHEEPSYNRYDYRRMR